MSLDVEISIHGPGGWILLEDPENGYTAHKEALASKSVTWRKKEIESDYVEGTFTNEAVRANIVEQLVIYVDGLSPWATSERVRALTEALEQLQYEVKVRDGDLEETWTCSVADYTLETGQELRNATMVIVRASVPRLPYATRVQVV